VIDPTICPRCGSDMDYEGTYESDGLEEELYICPRCVADRTEQLRAEREPSEAQSLEPGSQPEK
jgi:hypothetical protein